MRHCSVQWLWWKMTNPTLWLVRNIGGKEPHPLYFDQPHCLSSVPLRCRFQITDKKEKNNPQESCWIIRHFKKVLVGKNLFTWKISEKNTLQMGICSRVHTVNLPPEAERHTERNPGTSFSFFFPGALPLPTVPACFICLLNAPSTDFSFQKISGFFSLHHRSF